MNELIVLNDCGCEDAKVVLLRRRWLLLRYDLCLPDGEQRELIGRNFFTEIHR